jgi:hypothetical protein
VVDPFGDDDWQRAQRRRALHEQRMLLIALQGEVSDAVHRLEPAAPEHWRSESARRYAERRDRLRDEVRQLLWSLDGAVNEAATALSALSEHG